VVQTELEELVAGRHRQLIAGDDPRGLAILAKAVRDLDPPETNRQPIRWSADNWASKPQWQKGTLARINRLSSELEPTCDGGHRLIRREDVFDRAGDAVDLFLATMAWGYGTVGYGWWRTAGIINAGGRNGEQRVAAAVAAYRAAHLEEGFSGVARAWTSGGGKLPGLGPAFASKVAYFACYDRESGTGPLITDVNTAWSLWALYGVWDSRYSPDLYDIYVEWCQRQAVQHECRSDDIERALFGLGSRVRAAWNRHNAQSGGT
jgi:hypothetical protein